MVAVVPREKRRTNVVPIVIVVLLGAIVGLSQQNDVIMYFAPTESAAKTAEAVASEASSPQTETPPPPAVEENTVATDEQPAPEQAAVPEEQAPPAEEVAPEQAPPEAQAPEEQALETAASEEQATEEHTPEGQAPPTEEAAPTQEEHTPAEQTPATEQPPPAATAEEAAAAETPPAEGETTTTTTTAAAATTTTTVESPEAADNGSANTLVVYSGPTSVNKTLIDARPIHQLYVKNFEYFLKTGIECDVQDTVLVVTESVASVYKERVEAIDTECRKQGHRVILHTRNNTCWDMESAWVVFGGNVVNISSYDNYVYVNCGMTGPPTREERNGIPWTYNFTSLLNEEVAMSGLTHNCYAWAHIQSFVYAFNRAGLTAALEGGAIYDCRTTKAGQGDASSQKSEIITRYEMGMSRAVFNGGFAIETTIRPRVFRKEDLSWCVRNHTDVWRESRLIEEFGHIPLLTETMFFKSSRLMTDDIRGRIQFEGRAVGHWK